jgi:uncharacterized membrane protein
MSPGRLHALVDGVVAIAITLLVLDLPHPRGSEDLARDLLDEWPAYIAYAVSFATVGVVWIEHTGMMSAVRHVNRRFIERTLVFLFFVSIVPWPTSLAAEYVREGGAQARTATLLFAGTMTLMGLGVTLGWRYLAANEDLVVEPARSALPAAARRSLLGTLAYVPALVLALLLPLAALVVTGAIAAYFALSHTAVPGLAQATVPDDTD